MLMTSSPRLNPEALDLPRPPRAPCWRDFLPNGKLKSLTIEVSTPNDSSQGRSSISSSTAPAAAAGTFASSSKTHSGKSTKGRTKGGDRTKTSSPVAVQTVQKAVTLPATSNFKRSSKSLGLSSPKSNSNIMRTKGSDVYRLTRNLSSNASVSVNAGDTATSSCGEGDVSGSGGQVTSASDKTLHLGLLAAKNRNKLLHKTSSLQNIDHPLLSVLQASDIADMFAVDDQPMTSPTYDIADELARCWPERSQSYCYDEGDTRLKCARWLASISPEDADCTPEPITS